MKKIICAILVATFALSVLVHAQGLPALVDSTVWRESESGRVEFMVVFRMQADLGEALLLAQIH